MALLEVCVDSLAGLRAAEEGGAGRIELCSRLDLGGLSPDRELLEAALGNARLPLHVMVRTRPGSFVYTPSMETEILSLRGLGVPGVVLGALTADRRLDSAALRRLVAAARPMSITFHRAFDEIAEQLLALDELIELGFDRVLTSGGAPDAFQGRGRLRELVSRARGRIVVMAGGGVRADNAAAILRDAGVPELHGSVPFRL
ncbi:MAG: copper homeostasis protein CutC [Planctomycetota bacterium]